MAVDVEALRVELDASTWRRLERMAPVWPVGDADGDRVMCDVVAAGRGVRPVDVAAEAVLRGGLVARMSRRRSVGSEPSGGESVVVSVAAWARPLTAVEARAVICRQLERIDDGSASMPIPAPGHYVRGKPEMAVT